MAMIQILKAPDTTTVTKTAVDQKQSLEVVQTMLHGTLSSLSFLREFFAEKAFGEQLYQTRDEILPYKDYAAGKLGNDRDPAVGRDECTTMRVLLRGRSKRVDMFLDWLEKGAFVALKAGDLRAMQVYVHADPADREKVIETYTFTIKYNKNANNTRDVAGLEVDSGGSSSVSVEATNKALHKLLKEVIDLCPKLPDLPQKRYISMALFYVEDAEKEYKAKGFVPGVGDGLMFAQAEGWERTTKELLELGSHFHNSSLRVSYLQESAQPPKLSSDEALPFPEVLLYGTISSKRAEIDAVVTSTDQIATAPKLLNEMVSHEAATPSTVMEYERERTVKADEDCPRTATNPTTPAPTSDTLVAMPADEPSPAQRMQELDSPALEPREGETNLSVMIDTQSSNILNMRKSFQSMIQPERITQGDTQTQTATNQPHPPPSESTITPSRTSASPFLTKTKLPDLASSKPILSQAKAKQLRRDVTQLRRRTQKAGRKAKTGEITICECGHAEEEDDMVQCAYCDTWQHLHCYGYTDSQDVRLPDDHVCYRCLLGTSEPRVLKTLEDLAVKRRAMSFALQHGLGTQQDFAADLGMEKSIAGLLYQHLRSEGYVIPARNSHRASNKATGRRVLVPVRSGPDHDKMLRDLFDPLLHISHHYKLPAAPETQLSGLTQRLLAAQSNNMPPPATPASQLRRRDATTPASSLSTRTAKEPVQTPSRQLRPRKRATEESPNEAPTSKRRAPPNSDPRRYKSLQSEYMLDAGGLLSSPFNLQSIR